MSSQPKFWQKIMRCFGSATDPVFDQPSGQGPHILLRAKHSVSRKDISSNAVNVLYRLHKAGYEAYLVGGGVRDLLVGQKPKDFDVVTNAEPEQIRRLFSNSRLIGRRFQLVHVFYRQDIVEVSTFRRGHDSEAGSGMIRDDNKFGTLEQDVWRRDFTMNALYYNIADFSIVDYTGGLKDIQRKIVRMIGNPELRFQEDPMRMLRAIRLAAKLNFSIHEDIERLFQPLTELLQHVPPSRLFDEVLKLFFTGNAFASYERLKHHDFLKILFPQYVSVLSTAEAAHYQALVEEAMHATDYRYKNDQSLNPGFLFSVLLWPALQELIQANPLHKKKLFYVLHKSIEEVLDRELVVISIPKRLTAMMRDIWMLQYHLKQRRGKRVYRTLNHRYYRAAIDFMMLREKVGEPVAELVTWWRNFQSADEALQKQLLDALQK